MTAIDGITDSPSGPGARRANYPSVRLGEKGVRTHRKGRQSWRERRVWYRAGLVGGYGHEDPHVSAGLALLGAIEGGAVKIAVSSVLGDGHAWDLW